MNQSPRVPTSRLSPPPAEVLAKRRGINRILIALVVMVAAPALIYILGNKLVDQQINSWMRTPTIRFNEVTQVTMPKAGKYVVWSSVEGPQCSLSKDGVDIHLYPHESPYAPQYPVGSFHIDTPGTITIECIYDDEEAYARISTESPNVKIALLKLGTWGLTFIVGVIGAVMTVVALAKNRDEKKQQFAPTMYAAPPWPPRH
ncbi:MAG: hypothetical protein FWG08_01460 [Propionibacteriaceae bacterium]|nr:hypothetical protein [Propionibacteriaceae bacterium]